ncbi:RTA1 like protein-domain-containing protein [Aspergillus alliaceus]|uniref:RTA1 like protein-domain-containing protein n=1 Tax=Petromyces alliaceus TaxID=209559 RepID=A0A5N7BSH1_PETAA|nr:RTA1 like protein-domain-containing protein [Aspergillus alliaceus]
MKVPDCHVYDTNIHSSFGYRPLIAAGIVFTLGRAIAYRCPDSVILLEEQLVLLILGIYCILSMMVSVLGKEKSLLNRRSYLIIFIRIGGDMSASTLDKDGNELPGTYTMAAGIIFQLVSLCIFAIFFQCVMFRAITQIMRDPHLRDFCIAVNLSIVFLLIRGVFRSIELLQGWRGYLFTHEIYAIILDAVMVLLSLLVFNIFNPAILIAKARKASVSTSVELRECSVEGD